MQLPVLKDLLEFKYLAKYIKNYHKQTSNNSLSGSIKTRAKGQGLDFYQVRKYVFGDDTRNIDWRVSARTNQIHIKEFHEDKEAKIDIICDISPKMQFATRGRFKYLLAADIVSLICFASDANNEIIQAIFFGENLADIEIFKQKNQKSVTLPILNFLCIQQEQKIINSANNLAAAVKSLNSKTKTKGICFIITTQIELEDYLKHELAKLSKKKQIFIINISDIFDFKLPHSGKYSFVNAENKEIILNLADKNAVKLYNQAATKRHNDLCLFCDSIKAKLINLATNDDVVAKICAALN